MKYTLKKTVVPLGALHKPVPREIGDNEVMSYELLEEHEAVKQALESLPDLKKPDSDLKNYLNKLGNIPEATEHELEKYLAVLAHWHSYYEVKLQLASVIRSVANEQKKKFFKIALSDDLTKATITEKKERAYSNFAHLEAVNVCQVCDIKHDAIQTFTSACERAYKAVSRIVSIREKLP